MTGVQTCALPICTPVKYAVQLRKEPIYHLLGDFIDKLVYEKIWVKIGHTFFSTIIVDCDVVICLDISDELLAEHCKKRGNNFLDAKNVKNSIEEDWIITEKRMEKHFII